jgi:long-chain acyl-CoA synthetase
MSDTLASAWSKTVRRNPTGAALIDGATGRIWTRAELDAAAEKWAAAHRDLVEGRLALFSELNGAAWFTLFLGLLKAGAVVAALDPGDPLEAQQRAAVAIGASALFTHGNLHQLDGGRRTRPDGRRLIKLTSGTTGAPKALTFTDAQIIADGRQVCRAMGIKSADINFGLIPFGHSYGLGNLVVPLIEQGTAIVGGSAALPHVIASEIARHRPTVFPAVPALLRALAESEVSKDQLSSLRTIISAGAPLSPEVATAFHQRFGKHIHNFYGSSETGGIAYDRTGMAALTARSVGTPIPGVTITFDRGGRVAVSSAAVYTFANRRRVGAHGSHRTADLGELTSKGELVLHGRAGRAVKIAGRRLELGEVERALRAIPGVTEAFAMLHPERADALAAAVVARQSPAELKEALKVALASWKIPRKLIALAHFPLTARGKTDTRQLQALLSS